MSEYRKLMLAELKRYGCVPKHIQRILETLDECIDTHTQGCVWCNFADTESTYDYCLYNLICGGKGLEVDAKSTIEQAVLAWKVDLGIYPQQCLAFHAASMTVPTRQECAASKPPALYDTVSYKGQVAYIERCEQMPSLQGGNPTPRLFLLRFADGHPHVCLEVEQKSWEIKEGQVHGVRLWNKAVAQCVIAQAPRALLEFGWRRGAAFDTFQAKVLAVLEQQSIHGYPLETADDHSWLQLAADVLGIPSYKLIR